MCLSITWLKDLFIYAIVIGAVIAILLILVNYVLSKLPGQFAEAVSVLTRIAWIVIYAAIAVFVVVVGFMLISCLLSWAGGFPSLGHR